MKKTKQQAAPEFITDADGQRLALVSLAHTGQRATLYAEDYRRLMDAGFSPFWNLTADGRGNAYPALGAYTAQGHYRMVTVARLLEAPGAGKRVRCADGNNLNLRTENRELEDAPVRRSAADWYPNVTALRVAGIEPVKRDKKTKGAEEPRQSSVNILNSKNTNSPATSRNAIRMMVSKSSPSGLSASSRRAEGYVQAEAG